MHRVPRTLAALTLLLTACSGIEDPLSRHEKRELVSARARWNNSPVRNAYRYDVRQSCFCPVEITRWNTLTVIDGVVTDVKTETGEAVPRDRWGSYATVERLFSTLEVERDTQLEDITVRFDAKYGYPLEMNFIYGPQIADGGGAFFARNLMAVTR